MNTGRWGSSEASRARVSADSEWIRSEVTSRRAGAREATMVPAATTTASDSSLAP